MTRNELFDVAEAASLDGEDDDRCWIWPGPKDRGYGDILYNRYKTYAHRAMWIALYGWESLGGLCVLHRCDNPPCFRPLHLFIGTKKDNAQDMSRKGRASTARRGCENKKVEWRLRLRQESFGATG